MPKNETVFSKDLPNRKLNVIRAFDSPLEQVWEAWTNSAILDQWWAPKPYKAVTKVMDFREGGRWHYLMAAPEGVDNSAWCRVDFKTIKPPASFTSTAWFCDEAARINEAFPPMYWSVRFTGNDNTTTVKVEISFDKDADLEWILKMGFQQGFTMGLGNLDEYLSAHAHA